MLQKGQLMGQTNWTSLGMPGGTGALAPFQVVQNADGRLEVFLLSLADGTLWHIWQTMRGKAWGSWASLGHPPDDDFQLASGTNADGRIEVFTIGDDGNLWHIWQTAPGGSWSSWNSLRMPGSSIGYANLTVGRNADGRLEVFLTGPETTLWHSWQQMPGGSWSSWNSLDQLPLGVRGSCVAQNKDGHLEVLATDDDGTLWHSWQQTPGGSWSSWQSLGTPPPAGTSGLFTPYVIANADGRLEAFATASPIITSSASPGSSGSDNLWHTWQVTPGGEWGS
jgi:hypothetical protein